MNNEVKIGQISNPDKFEIDAHIEYLKEQKAKGATHVRYWKNSDRLWGFEWVETFMIKSAEQLKQEEIKSLEDKLNKLKS